MVILIEKSKHEIFKGFLGIVINDLTLKWSAGNIKIFNKMTACDNCEL